MNIPGHPSYPNYRAYYVKDSNSERAIPAIFTRDSEQADEAELFFIKGQQAVETPDQAIKIALADLEEALKVVLPLVKIAASEGFLMLALAKGGYTWPGVEPVVIELSQTAEEET